MVVVLTLYGAYLQKVVISTGNSDISKSMRITIFITAFSKTILFSIGVKCQDSTAFSPIFKIEDSFVFA